MRLKRLKEVIDECVERAGDCDPEIEIWYKKKMYRLGSVGQFNIVPTVTITIGELVYDEDEDGVLIQPIVWNKKKE